jgi:PAT family beta-lactamase induction signal transducer AmpG
MSTTTSAKKQIWRDFASKRVGVVLLLGFVSGLPLALSFSTLSAWLVEAGITRTAIGLFAAVGTPYALKFLWSPLVDGIRLPWLCKTFGRRRGWLFFAQGMVMTAMLLLGASDPAINPWFTALFALMLAAASATQDIVIDAYRIELLNDEEQGSGSAAVQLGYRLGMLASGGGGLALAELFGWQATYTIMAGMILIGVVAAFVGGEPARTPPFTIIDRTLPAMQRMAAWGRAAVLEPFRDFLKREGAWWILLFVLLFKMGDAFLGVMANTFYLDIGFSKLEIAQVVKVFGLAATLLGLTTGAWLARKIGLVNALWFSGTALMLANLLYVWQAHQGHDIGALHITIGVDNFFGGMDAAVFVAFISRLCNARFTATQYALLSSLAAVGRTQLSTGAGFMSELLGWPWFFTMASALALPGLLLLLKIQKLWHETPIKKE